MNGPVWSARTARRAAPSPGTSGARPRGKRAKYSPDQPRVSAGSPEGGQWTSGDGSGGGGLVQVRHLTDEKFERLQQELEENFSGAVNAGRPLLLEGGLDWKALSLSPKDMDVSETKASAAREIALAFGVPPPLIGLPGDDTFRNYEEANRAFWRQTSISLAQRLQKTFQAWAFRPYVSITTPTAMRSRRSAPRSASLHRQRARALNVSRRNDRSREWPARLRV